MGALLGLVFALIGVSLTLLTGDGVWDAVGTAMTGLLLVAIAVVLALETKSLLLGESAAKDAIELITAAIEAGGGRIIHLKTLHLGPEELLVAAKIAIGHSATGEQIAQDIDSTEARTARLSPWPGSSTLSPTCTGQTPPTQATCRRQLAPQP